MVAELSFSSPTTHNSRSADLPWSRFPEVIWRLPRTESCDFSTDLSSFAMADEEPVDQKKYLEESCKPKCVKPFLEYQACVKRIQDDDSGHKHCTGQYFDFWSCIDKCVAPKLFPKLK